MSNSTIHFFNEDVSYKLKNKGILRNWIGEIAKDQGYRIADLNFILCSDEYLLVLNTQYLNHDTYTDVITFDNNPEADSMKIIGDIFISIDRIIENANKIGVSTENELHRVMIHGALHLMGYKDKSAADKLKMTQMEDSSLALLSL